MGLVKGGSESGKLINIKEIVIFFAMEFLLFWLLKKIKEFCN